MQIGKYVTSLPVITALIGAIGAARQSKSMPHDWRRIVVWGVWAAGVALAIGGVAFQEADEERKAEAKHEAKQFKDAKKAVKKAAKRVP